MRPLSSLRLPVLLTLLALAPASPPPAAAAPGAPGEIERLWSRGEAALRAGDAAEALRAFGEALALDEGRARSWNYLGGAHFARGELARARAEFERAVGLDPGDSRACNNLGTVLERLGEFALAERRYLDAALADPAYPVPHRNLGILYARSLGRPEDARRAWLRYLELAPAGPDAEQVRSELAALPAPAGPR